MVNYNGKEDEGFGDAGGKLHKKGRGHKIRKKLRRLGGVNPQQGPTLRA